MVVEKSKNGGTALILALTPRSTAKQTSTNKQEQADHAV